MRLAQLPKTKRGVGVVNEYEFDAVKEKLRKCWPRLDFENEEILSLAREKLERFPQDVVISAVAGVFQAKPHSYWPDWSAIVSACFKATRPVFDPSRWTVTDEVALWNWMHDRIKHALYGKGKPLPEWTLDEGRVARRIVGKNPSTEERNEASDSIKKWIDKQPLRPNGEKLWYPWDAVDELKRRYADAQQGKLDGLGTDGPATATPSGDTPASMFT